MKRPPSAIEAYAAKVIEYLRTGKTQTQCAAENEDLRLSALAEWSYNLAVTTRNRAKGKVYFV